MIVTLIVGMIDSGVAARLLIEDASWRMGQKDQLIGITRDLGERATCSLTYFEVAGVLDGVANLLLLNYFTRDIICFIKESQSTQTRALIRASPLNQLTLSPQVNSLDNVVASKSSHRCNRELNTVHLTDS